MSSTSEFLGFDELSSHVSMYAMELARIFGECRAAAKIPAPASFFKEIGRGLDDTDEGSIEESTETTLEELLECTEITEELPSILRKTSKNLSRVNSRKEVSAFETPNKDKEKASTLENVLEFFKNSTEEYEALRRKLNKTADKFQQYETKVKELKTFLGDLEKSLPQEEGRQLVETLPTEVVDQIGALRKNIDILSSAKIQISYSENDHEQLSRILDLVMPIAKQLLLSLE